MLNCKKKSYLFIRTNALMKLVELVKIMAKIWSNNLLKWVKHNVVTSTKNRSYGVISFSIFKIMIVIKLPEKINLVKLLVNRLLKKVFNKIYLNKNLMMNRYLQKYNYRLIKLLILPLKRENKLKMLSKFLQLRNLQYLQEMMVVQVVQLK